MKSKKKLLILVICTLSLCMTGCWDSREIDTLAIVTSIGIDKSQDDYVVTLQVLHPVVISMEQVNKAPVVLYKERGKNVLDAIQRITTRISRNIYLSYVNIIIFGEELAKEGIADVLDYVARNHEFRTDIYFAVAKNTTANNILSILTPLETIPSNKMTDTLEKSEELWAPTKTVRIIELVNDIVSDGKEAVLSGIELSGDKLETINTEQLRSTKLENELILSNLGVFKKDQFVGWLNEGESKGYNYIINNVTNTAGFVEVEDGTVGLYLNNAKAKQKAYLSNGRLGIKVTIDLECDIKSLEAKLDITKEENLEKLNQLLNDKIAYLCFQSIEKAQKDFKSDIFGFGEVIHRTYPDIWKDIKDNWDDEFIALPVQITVNAKVKGVGSISKSFFSE